MFPRNSYKFIKSFTRYFNNTWTFPLTYSRFKYVWIVSRFCSSVPGTTGNILNANHITENMFARNVIESNPHYKELVVHFPPNKFVTSNSDFEIPLEITNVSNISVSELCELIQRLSGSISVPISHPSCDNIRLAIKENCQKFSDEQLAGILKSLAQWPLPPFSKNLHYRSSFIELDNVCLSRWKIWNLKKVFLFMDLWYGLQLAKYSNFFFKAATKLAHNPTKMTPNQVVLLLFHLNMLRTATKNIKMFELEYRLEQVAPELTIDELGVAVMGFFKADKCLFNVKLMEHLINRVMKEIKTIPDITFTSIVKALRKSIPTPLWPKLGEFFDAITPEIPRLSIPPCVHSGLVTTKPQFLHEPLLRAISQKVSENISECRLKDMEKAVFPLVQLVFDPQTKPCIFNTILKELERPERKNEIETFPKSFIALVHYFCLKGIYPEKFIQKILDPDFIKTVYGPQKYNFGRELLCIDTSVELDFPSYTGPRLPHEIRNYLAKRYSEYLPDATRKLSQHQNKHLGIIQTAEVLFGKEFIAVKYLLPSHPRADIVVHLDENMKPLPLSKSLENAENFTGPLEAPGKNYYALVVGSKNLCLYNSTKINGETACKIKQLKLIGYTPVIIPSGEWPKASTFEKVQHLKEIVSSAHQASQEP